MKVADEFIPELVDTLASQMDPQVVCSVAGLCNNERYIKMLADEGEVTESKAIEKPTTCSGCQTVMTVVERKFRQATRDQVLQGLLHVRYPIKLLQFSFIELTVVGLRSNGKPIRCLQQHFNYLFQGDLCSPAGQLESNGLLHTGRRMQFYVPYTQRGSDSSFAYWLC